jgi:hypothetical protein
VTDADEVRPLDQFPFEFYGARFSVFLAADRRLYVPLSDLCEAMEIDTNAQAQRIRRNEAINDTLLTLPLQVPYGDEGALQTRRMLCLWLNRLPYWLGTIDASRIPDAARRRQVVRFQREFADVAWAAFRPRFFRKTCGPKWIPPCRRGNSAIWRLWMMPRPCGIGWSSMMIASTVWKSA